MSAGGFHRLHYCDWGERDNPQVVVCVHGYGRHARDFDGVARALSANYRVICPDLAARGERDWLGTAIDASVPQLLADLNVLLSSLNLAQVHWIGTALGARLGMIMAALPGSPIRRLVLHDVEPQVLDARHAAACPALLLPGNAPQSMTPKEIDVIGNFLGAAAVREPCRYQMA